MSKTIDSIKLTYNGCICEYDTNGLLTKFKIDLKHIGPFVVEHNLEYDSINHRVIKDTMFNITGTIEGIVTYEYDDKGRLDSVVETKKGCSHDDIRFTKYHYNDDGSVIKTTNCNKYIKKEITDTNMNIIYMRVRYLCNNIGNRYENERIHEVTRDIDYDNMIIIETNTDIVANHSDTYKSKYSIANNKLALLERNVD